ncbi:MAG: Rrf2 family transcriptional regulator [Gracilibacteraceae bacterium]|nr:Rrf2 family transcriptional regulator [Gracilibacteraceae bacterium]
MKISSKGRYALAAMILLAQNSAEGSPLTVIAIAGKLAMSKIYLEQVFALLRKGGLVTSIKGSQGGYQLARSADKISAADVLAVTETSIFEDTESTAPDSQPGIERALQDSLFTPANSAVKEIFGRMSLADLAEESLRKAANEAYMYCI